VATRQLPLPPFLGKLLLALGALLVFGGLAIVSAAARESVLAPGVPPGKTEHRKGLVAGAVTAIIFVALLWGGKKWWLAEEAGFRRHLREGAWPDLAADVRVENGQRILHLTLGQKAFAPNYSIPLAADHGKLLHLFLVREPNRDGFAHVHPVRTGGKTFEVALPPLAEGDYRVLCDLTFEESGLSTTATNSVRLAPMPAAAVDKARPLEPDPDDSWASYPVESVATLTGSNGTCRLPGGDQVVWGSAFPIRAKQDAALQFEVRDAAGKPIALEPYMGMLSHAAVLRGDGAIFAHLHPSGNYSMAAQDLFKEKMQRETGASESDKGTAAAMDHSAMGHMQHHMRSAVTSISLPYEFPTAGEYRLWVQFKTSGRVLTAIFDATVLPR